MAEPLTRVLLATSNRGKLADFRALFSTTGIELVMAGDAGVELEVEETGASFEENALLKARAYAAALKDAASSPRAAPVGGGAVGETRTSTAVMADDSGLVVAALGGEPGIYSARYAGPECDNYANNLKVLDALEGASDRSAAFVCVLALVLPDGRELLAEGRSEGVIAREEVGDKGFGYDPIFFRPDLGRTFGEVSIETKNALSHRGTAARAMVVKLSALGLLPAAKDPAP